MKRGIPPSPCLCPPPPLLQAAWQQRKTNAARAFKQYLPVREGGGGASMPDGLFQLYRTFTFGDLATVVLPETR